MRKVGLDIPAVDRWQGLAASYAGHINGAYHRHRLDVISALLPDLRGKTVVDFGCGEGVLAQLALAKGARVIGIDPVQSLLDIAARRAPAARYICGGVEALDQVERCDVLLAANVLAYLSKEEERRFYGHALRTCVELVVTHSNSLFDLFTFNAYTVAFCREQFGFDATPLVVNPTKPERLTFSVRENPLAYPQKLRSLGFTVERTEYMNLHRAPPLLTKDDPDDMERARLDTLNVPLDERWKLNFQCSMFGVRARRYW